MFATVILRTPHLLPSDPLTTWLLILLTIGGTWAVMFLSRETPFRQRALAVVAGILLSLVVVVPLVLLFPPSWLEYICFC